MSARLALLVRPAGRLLGLTCLALGACRDPQPEAGTAGSAGGVALDETSEARADPVLGALPPFALRDQRGVILERDDLLGAVWIANFVFTTCPVCKELSRQMAALQADLGAGTEARLVSFSVDPEHDTPEVLAAYGAEYGADPERWRLLTGTRRVIWQLARDGFKLPVADQPSPDGMPILHSKKFIVVDREGRIRGYHDADTPEARTEIVSLVTRLRAESTPRILPIPADVRAPEGLAARREAQIAAWAKTGGAPFAVTDRLPESGITYRHHIADDSARDHKGVHYDHGNSLAVADVDNDGRPDLLFVDQLGPPSLWRNLGEGRFEDATPSAGLATGERVGVAASFADADNDGDVDLLYTSVRGGNLLFENDGKGRFTDVTTRAGLGYVGHSSAPVFFDFDRDGLLDVFLANVGKYTTEVRGRGGYLVGHKDAFASHLKPERRERSVLYRNKGGLTFEDVTDATALIEEGFTGDAAPWDVNEDGFVDLYVANMQGPDELWINEPAPAGQGAGGRRFSRQSERYFPTTPWGAMGLATLDVDGDGRLDLYVTDMHTDMAPPQGLPVAREKDRVRVDEMFPRDFLATDRNIVLGNALFRNLGPGPDGAPTFEERALELGLETFWPWGPSLGDLDADGRLDLYVTGGMSYNYRYGLDSVLLNAGAEGFRDAELALGVEPRSRTAKPWFDLDCAGADAAHEVCRRERKPERLSVWAARSSRSAAILDLEGDGDQDIVVHAFGEAPRVLVSDLSARRSTRWLEVQLEGTRSNRAGLGAVVTVVRGEARGVRLHDGRTGYLSQGALPLWFGLGEAEAADRVEVLWPSGTRQTVEGPHAHGARLRVVEPAVEPPAPPPTPEGAPGAVP